jgi:hypothetical protein
MMADLQPSSMPKQLTSHSHALHGKWLTHHQHAHSQLYQTHYLCYSLNKISTYMPPPQEHAAAADP